ncbi:hypothetical protein [Leptospira kirschneri]|uniref:nSTAND3 domain-containing NTPase n=1 Tax=Leptospira kirschneri TaxID=29507 RepID=UPI0002BE3D1F|nr:hypothetical protein [Leptospira kirschneri]EMN25349.1 restriction endonuclease [Leptospira kirschneri serovar Sokoine str. RM1]
MNFIFEKSLSWLDFQMLAKDILNKMLNIEMLNFAEGKDQGIDLRYFVSKDYRIIAQCKRIKNLTKKIIDEEYKKIVKIDFEEFYLVFSSDPSVNLIDYIKNKFHKWMPNGDLHIINGSRLNDFLYNNIDILLKHHKLWFQSTDLLKLIQNEYLESRSFDFLMSIQKEAVFYYKSNAFFEAIKILKEQKVIIISGIPGIGKTTLSKILILELIKDKFDIRIIRNIIEGEKLLSQNSKNGMVLYFDDFLGENFLRYDAMQGRSRDYLDFIERVQRSKDKYLIVTTREYILQQAIREYPKLLESEMFRITKYILELEKYNIESKAYILYNHLYYSKNITNDYMRMVLVNNSYEKIINHPNYNPRVISAMTREMVGIPPGKYIEEFYENLNNPHKVWRDVFRNLISNEARILLIVFLCLDGNCLLRSLNNEYEKLLSHASKYLYIESTKLFVELLKEIEGTFTLTKIDRNKTQYIEFHNPSIKDFLIDEVLNYSAIINAIIETTLNINTLLFIKEHLITEDKSQMVSIILEKLLINYDSLVNLKIEFRWFEKNLDLPCVEINPLTNINKLYKISESFDPIQYRSVRNKIIKFLESVDFLDFIEEREINLLKHIITKVKIFVTYPYKILEILFKSIDDSDSLFNFFSFSDVFEKEFDLYLNNKSTLITDKFEKIVTDSFCSDYSYRADVYETLSGIKIENYFKDKNVKAKILYQIDRLEEYYNEKEKESNKRIIDKKVKIEKKEPVFSLDSIFNEDMLMKDNS